MSNNVNASFCVNKKAQSVFFILTLALIIAFSGCSQKTVSVSAMNQFDVVDSLISQGQYNDALKDLKKISKKIYDNWSYIGVYKRYFLLGETELCEKTLKKGLKANPNNLELTAIYSKFLLNNNRSKEAEKQAELLKKTRYAGIYAECVFTNYLYEKDTAALNTDPKFFDLYYDAYQTSKNPVWLRNCAASYLAYGKYKSASELMPLAFNDASDAYFWALVGFDAGEYIKSINACDSAFAYLESLNARAVGSVSEIKLGALESDSYNALSDTYSAHQIRENILAHYVAGMDLNEALTSDEKSLLPLIVVNSATEEKIRQNNQASVDLLSFCVMNYPEYAPALIEYANYAYESNLPRREDDEITALRKAGLKTLEMERYDSRAKIPLSDAMSRLDKALMTVQNSDLYITRLDLRYKSNNRLTVRDKNADLWRLLEESSSEDIPYHDKLVQYTVHFLLENNFESDAFAILKKYLIYKYNLIPESQQKKNSKMADVFEQMAERTRTADIEDLEMVAWFALNQKKTEEALRILEYCVYESSGDRGTDISPKVSTNSAMNLANLYYGLAQKEKALDLYGKIGGRETDKKFKSLAFYRIAGIYYALGEEQSALRAVDYACSIDPENAQAHLLKTKLTVK